MESKKQILFLIQSVLEVSSQSKFTNYFSSTMKGLGRKDLLLPPKETHTNIHPKFSSNQVSIFVHGKLTLSMEKEKNLPSSCDLFSLMASYSIDWTMHRL